MGDDAEFDGSCVMVTEATPLLHGQLKYLFVVTYGRSGSTVLLNLLNTIDGYCIRGENHGISNELAKACSVLAKAKSDYGKESSEPWRPWYGIGDVEPEVFGLSLANAFCSDVLRPKPDTRVVGFKEVRYSPHDISDEEYDCIINFLAENFTDSRFIFNTRDWQEVANSGWWKEFWSRKSVKRIVEQSNARFSRSQSVLGSRAFTIDYSKYSKDSAGFHDILEWLGEDVSQSLIENVIGTKLDHAIRKFRPRGLKSRLKRITRLFF
jgi:hypothetical protein